MTTVSVKLQDLTREQLEREVERLQGLTDKDLRQEVELYRREAYQCGYQLDDICSCLNYHGIKYGDKPHHGVRLMARRMAEAEKKLTELEKCS